MIIILVCLLMVPGALISVGNLTYMSSASVIALTWKPPFSLCLTAADPDIIYCVDIFNITTEALPKDQLVTNCSVFEPHYNFTIEQPNARDLFQFIVTPRSNMEGAKNGTASEINGTFLFQSTLLTNFIL